MTPKEQLYYLTNEFIKGNYDTETYCNQFTIIFDTEINYEDLNEVENKLFLELCSVTARFSPSEEDLSIENTYYNEQEVKEEVLKVKSTLNYYKCQAHKQ